MFVIEREEGRAVAGVEDNKFIAWAARLVFLSDRELLRRKRLRGSGGENEVMLAVLFEMPARCKKTLLFNPKSLLKYSKQGSVFAVCWWFLVGFGIFNDSTRCSESMGEIRGYLS